MTDEQKEELKNIYKGLKQSKEKESKVLYQELFKTIDFINIPDNLFIKKVGIYTSWGHKGKKNIYGSELKSAKDLPITVICYLITKDDEYLQLGKYRKYINKGITYIYTSRYGYNVSEAVVLQKDISKFFYK